MSSYSAVPTRALVLGLVDGHGVLSLERVYGLASACGLSDQQVRLCVRRLAAEGKFEHVSGRGRRALFRAVGAAGTEILPERSFLEFALAQDAGAAAWDGVWRMVGFSIPEARRAVRDEFRGRLVLLGGGAVHAGLYVSPNPWTRLVLAEAERLGVREDLTLARAERLSIGHVSDPRQLASGIWPLREVADGYREFLRTLRARVARVDRSPRGSPAVVQAALEAVVAFSRAIEPDPLLPPELLPREWIGGRARRSMLAAAARFLDAAGDEAAPTSLGWLLDVGRVAA